MTNKGFVRYAAFGCIKGPSGAGKSEIPVDTMAAVEAAERHRKAKADGNKKGSSESRWQVVKIDRQFVAVAKARGVERIYSDDSGVKQMARASGIEVQGVEELPLPPSEQPGLAFDGDGEEAITSTIEPQPPSEQSPDAAQEIASTPEPVPPLDLHDDPA